MRVQEGEENKQANTDKTKPHQAYLTHNKKAENNRKRLTHHIKELWKRGHDTLQGVTKAKQETNCCNLLLDKSWCKSMLAYYYIWPQDMQTM